MSRGLCSAFVGEGFIGGIDALVAFAHPGRVQVESADLLLHRGGGPFSERLAFALGVRGKFSQSSPFFLSTASAGGRKGGPEVGEYGVLNTFGANACRPLTDASRVTTPTTVDPVTVAVDGALETMAATIATKQPGEKMGAGVDNADVLSLRELPGSNVNDCLMGFRVDEAPIPAVGEFAQVDPVSQHPVNGGLAPGARTLRRGNACRFEDARKFYGSRATKTSGEHFRYDRCGQRVRFEASVVALPVADSDTVGDRDAVLDGALLRPLETGTRSLTNVGGELEQDARLQTAFGGRPVGGSIGRVNLSACVSDSSDECVSVLAVAGESVEPRDDDTGGLTTFDAGKSFLQSGALPLATGLVKVDDYLPDFELLSGGEFAAAPFLLVRGDEVFASTYTTYADVQINGGHDGANATCTSIASPSASRATPLTERETA